MRLTADQRLQRIDKAQDRLTAGHDLPQRDWLQLCQDIDELLLTGITVSIPMTVPVFLRIAEEKLGGHPAVQCLRSNPNFAQWSQANSSFEGYLVYVVAHLNIDGSISANGATKQPADDFLPRLLTQAQEELPDHPATQQLATFLGQP